jgi:hypothetical protein
VEFVFDQSVGHGCSSTVAPLSIWGGAPQRVVIDNLKAGIMQAAWDAPQVQATYRERAEHYYALRQAQLPASLHCEHPRRDIARGSLVAHGSMPPGRCTLPRCYAIVGKGPAGAAMPPGRSLYGRRRHRRGSPRRRCCISRPPFRNAHAREGTRHARYGCPFYSRATGASAAPIAICARALPVASIVPA